MKKEKQSPEACPVESVDVKLIDPSPANKRTFSGDDSTDKSLCDLADSIEAQGLLHPPVLRSHPWKKNRFELVCGERRWRAFRVKGWKKIPAVIRELTDSEAHAITATENLHRENLSPIEEAESVKVMLDDGCSHEEIADRVGKHLGWIMRRARIADLSESWKTAVTDKNHTLSKWSATHLELIARYDHQQQEELFKEFGQKHHSGYVMMSVRDLETELNGRMFLLSAALWNVDDETLCPEAGACTLCQKRTGCQPDLFEVLEADTVAADDRCLDDACWGKKLIAHHTIKIAEARRKHENLVLVDKSGVALPDNNPWAGNIQQDWSFKNSKKSDPEAVPAYIIDGTGAGRIEYKVPLIIRSAKSTPKNDADKTNADRQAKLQKRRVVRFINKLMCILSGDHPDTTSGVESPLSEDELRTNIAENLSHIEVHALVAAFGATVSAFGKSQWEIYKNIARMDGASASKTALLCAFERVVTDLRNITYATDPDIEFPNELCAALRLDREAIWEKVMQEIPEPKSWSKLKAADPETPPAKGKGSTLDDLVDTDAGDNTKPARYYYKGHTIFVSPGLGGKTYGTFRVSDGGGGIKRIVSKAMHMVSDRDEAQRNLDQFAVDNNLSRAGDSGGDDDFGED